MSMIYMVVEFSQMVTSQKIIMVLITFSMELMETGLIWMNMNNHLQQTQLHLMHLHLTQIQQSQTALSLLTSQMEFTIALIQQVIPTIHNILMIPLPTLILLNATLTLAISTGTAITPLLENTCMHG